jgi:hypothetical protein
LSSKAIVEEEVDIELGLGGNGSSGKVVVGEEIVKEVGSQGDGSGGKAIIEEEVDLTRSTMAKSPI